MVDLSKAEFYRVFSSPSEDNNWLWIEIGRNGQFCIQKENDDVKRIRFKFKNLQDFSSLLQRLSNATEQFIQSSTPKVNPDE